MGAGPGWGGGGGGVGAGLHQDFLKIDFLVVIDKEEEQLSEIFYQIKKHCS